MNAKICKSDTCERKFQPKRKNHFYCCKRCRNVQTNRDQRSKNKNLPYALRNSPNLDIKKYLVSCAKRRANKKNIEFNISSEDITIPEYCPVLPWIKIQSFSGDASPSIDRIDSYKGYIKGNVQIISWRANQIKSNSTSLEIFYLNKFLNNLNTPQNPIPKNE